tara:strand:- start:492 stop:1085 length:594 start_codon:yes stop_codon:yes gene_type:complete
MVYNREGYAPWSLTRKAGVQSATVDGTIEVPQYIQPTLDTGFVDEKGDWKGIKSSDEQFFAFTKDEAIPNGAAIITPSERPDGTWPLDMTGFSDLFIALKPTNGGNYNITAVMGPDTTSFANLRPVNAAAVLRGVTLTTPTSFVSVLLDGSEALTADVWNIFSIGYGVLKNQKLLQFSVTNNSGGESTIEAAFMRLV